MRLLQSLLDHAKDLSPTEIFVQLCSSQSDFTTGIQLNGILWSANPLLPAHRWKAKSRQSRELSMVNQELKAKICVTMLMSAYQPIRFQPIRLMPGLSLIESSPIISIPCLAMKASARDAQARIAKQ